MIIIQYIFAVLMVYQLCIYIAGIYKKRNKIIFSKPKTRFAILIPAHNEEKVIGSLVRNLRNLDYPMYLYDIYVICDNCTDNTYKEALDAGAIPLVRNDAVYKGKQWALTWGFERLFSSKYDAVCVFDADNQVSKNFLKVMNDKILRGEKLIQAYLDTKNPDDNWITKSYAISYWLMNRISQLARYNLGLSVFLGGTGFCVDLNMLKRYNWKLTSLTDDLELSIMALLDGIKPTLAYEAKVYDEKPLSLKASIMQRTRWIQGQADVIFRYLPSLLCKYFTTGKWMYMDAAIYIMTPVILLVNQIFIFIGTIGAIRGGFYLAMLIRSLIYQIIYMIVPLSLDKIHPKYWLATIYQPIYILTWIPIVVYGFMTMNNKKWVHTEHYRNIQIEEDAV